MRMIISLLLVCIISAALLSYVHSITKVQIEKQQKTNIIKRLNELLPEASYFDEIIKDTLWVGFNNARKTGIIFRIAPLGYAGPIPILVALGTDTVIRKIYIASAAEGLKETPGLGFKVRENFFREQFANRMYKDLQLTKDGGPIHAITAATISSRAVVDGIKEGIMKFQNYLNDNYNLNQNLNLDD